MYLCGQKEPIPIFVKLGMESSDIGQDFVWNSRYKTETVPDYITFHQSSNSPNIYIAPLLQNWRQINMQSSRSITEDTIFNVEKPPKVEEKNHGR